MNLINDNIRYDVKEGVAKNLRLKAASEQSMI